MRVPTSYVPPTANTDRSTPSKYRSAGSFVIRIRTASTHAVGEETGTALGEGVPNATMSKDSTFVGVIDARESEWRSSRVTASTASGVNMGGFPAEWLVPPHARQI